MKNYKINLILVAESTNAKYIKDGVEVYAPRQGVILVPNTSFSIEPVKGSSNVLVRGQYPSMFLSTLKKDYKKIIKFVYDYVYGNENTSYVENIKEHRVVNNYNDVFNSRTLRRIRMRNIRFTEASISNYKFNPMLTIRCKGRDTVVDPELGVMHYPWITTIEEHPERDGLDKILDKINKSDILGRDYNHIYKGLTKMKNPIIEVKHIRSAKVLNSQLSRLRGIVATNAPIRTAESAIAETSISAQPVSWRDVHAVNGLTISMPEGMKPLVKKWLRDDSCITITYAENSNYKLVEDGDFIHTVYKGVDLDSELNQYNRSRCDLTYNTNNEQELKEGTFSPAWKQQILVEEQYQSTLKSWSKQFTLLKVTDKELLEIIKYSIGNIDTIFDIEGKIGYAIDKINQDITYLKELKYTGDVYYKINKDVRLYLDGVAKKRPGTEDPEDDIDEDNMYHYQNDADEIIELYQDNYQVIDGVGYLVFNIK